MTLFFPSMFVLLEVTKRWNYKFDDLCVAEQDEIDKIEHRLQFCLKIEFELLQMRLGYQTVWEHLEKDQCMVRFQQHQLTELLL